MTDSTMFTGYDMDRTMLRIGAMNMMTHGIANPNIAYKDSLSEQNTDSGKYTKILANPPFKGSLNYEGVSTRHSNFPWLGWTSISAVMRRAISGR